MSQIRFSDYETLEFILSIEEKIVIILVEKLDYGVV